MAHRPLTIDIKRPLLCKNDDLFLITGEDGGVPPKQPSFGLFYRDCRYLGRYQLTLGGTTPLPLAVGWSEGFAAEIELTNTNLNGSDGKLLAVHTVGVRRKHLLIGEDCAFVDIINIRNFDQKQIDLPFALTMTAGFESMFVLRGTPPGKRGTMRAPQWDGKRLRFCYEGADGIVRRLDVSFSIAPVVAPATAGHTVANFDISLAPRQEKNLIVAFHISETPAGKAHAHSYPPPTLGKLRDYERRTCEGWLSGFTRAESDDALLNAVLHRSLSDLRLLRLTRDDCPFPAAGVPWFVGLFGRDSLIPALQGLAFDRAAAAHAARLLAGRQGCKIDARRHEEPGKILHELRVGEMAHLGEIPQTPSYSSIDSTILFVILIARHAAWTGSLDLFERLRPNVERALQWMAEFGDRNGDGYIEYDGKTGTGSPVNQGWKDSGNALIREDGTFPEPPISLVEVQGYSYLAKKTIAELYRRCGDGSTAERLLREAEALRERFNRDFWMEAKGCYCLALERDGRQVSVISSNPGQALWTGIADHDKARRTAERLMQPDMLSGWGVRTLSQNEIGYNPLDYQVGSVWPFDNSLILAGFRRYGLDAFACRIFESTLEAARRFPGYRLPEFFAGRQREDGLAPVHCPRADPLQAWSAAAVPFMLTELLGLKPHGFDGVLRIVRPVLPGSIRHLELHGLKVGRGSVDLTFERESGAIVPHVLTVEGDVKVQMD